MKKCCEQLVKDYGGKVPDKLEEVLKLAGVGRKTATLFSGGCLWDSRGYSGYPCISDFPQAGLGKREKPQQTEQELMKVLPRDHWNRINFQLIYLGREICTARKAKCTQCPLQEWCEKNL